MRWEDVPKISEDSDAIVMQVRAPACPIDSGTNWRQLFISVALVVLMGWLAVSAFATDPIPWIPAVLALVGVAGGLFMLASVIKSYLDRR